MQLLAQPEGLSISFLGSTYSATNVTFTQAGISAAAHNIGAAAMANALFQIFQQCYSFNALTGVATFASNLTDDLAADLIQRQVACQVIQRQLGEHPRFAFTYNGKPVKAINAKAWKRALRAAAIEDFRWHDLRHAWATRHIQAGTSTAELQELGGWQSSEMVRRYAHLAAEHLAKAAARIEPPDTKMATAEKG